ncbi:MAG: GbsR/MarR family transcriptional regulator [Candidatus Acidiferrales bacterium]
MTEYNAKRLSPVAQKFILHWGEMGTRWGINRTVAQVHALLYLSDRPLHAEEIARTLSVARSNVSTSLRELQAWRIVRPISVLGDRRQHFESMKNLWEMFRIILEERKRREIDPTIAVLRECVAEAGRGGSGEAYTRERVAAMLEFVETVSACYDEFGGLSPSAMKGLVRMRGKIRKLLHM